MFALEIINTIPTVVTGSSETEGGFKAYTSPALILWEVMNWPADSDMVIELPCLLHMWRVKW